MDQKVTPYLLKQIENPAISSQYVIPSVLPEAVFQAMDPLAEDTHEPVKGLVHKYTNRALIKVSYRCAAHCQFCTRTRQIGTDAGDLDPRNDVPAIVQYLSDHPEITDVILSGGDPLYNPKQTLLLLDAIESLDSVKVIRIGTRLPVHNPSSFDTALVRAVLDRIAALAKRRPFIVLVNMEHPDELTTETLQVLKLLRETGSTLLSQTVFLKGVNNDVSTLRRLFEELYWNGVIPYYLYRCDSVRGLERFVCDMDEEIGIVSELRRTLSGIACPTYIVDVEGTGKIPVPLNFWKQGKPTSCLDFNGVEVML